MRRPGASEVIFIALNYNITIVGKVWLVLMVFLRILILFFAGYPLYQDEQDRFVCNTIQPGCTNVCYDIFAPLSLFRFWLVQLTFISLPYIMFIVYVMHKVTANLPVHSEASEKMMHGSVYKIYKEPLCESSLSKSTVKCEVGRLCRFTGAYIFQLLLRILLEVGFGAANYYLFGFQIPKRFLCQQSPCTIMVDCYISRPTEKTIMLNFMLGASALSLLLNFIDLICAIKRSVKQKNRNKNRIMVEKMYEEERYFVSGNGGTSCVSPGPQDLLSSASFRKRISKSAEDGTSLQLDVEPHTPLPREGTPLGISLGKPGSLNGDSGYTVPHDGVLEREGSEVALCPAEHLGTPRSIRVSKRNRLKPPPPPRRDRPASTATLDITDATAVSTRRVGQYTLVELNTGSDQPPSSGEGQDKKSEWV
ncbi:gap junction delta-4 protein [Astyanax mexicanus]|uniref:gap junction delta-4 protein n=1 Tax=Astyanax mexicanus TaxID=7994 RepID=UPI0020CB2BAE|nr:gap junction delta-4 protein [Astyanax mexicanus]